MKRYGFNKATEFSKKQIGVIYANAKNGNIKVEKWVISEFYDLADYYGYDDNRGVEEQEQKILRILDAVFDRNYESAQRKIDLFTESAFNLMSSKYQSKADRSFL